MPDNDTSHFTGTEKSREKNGRKGEPVWQFRVAIPSFNHPGTCNR